MSAYVYLLQCKNNSLYTGYTTNVTQRLKTHQEGKGAKYTKSHLPVLLAYCQLFPDKSCALRQEARIKKFSRAKKLQICQNWSNETLRFATGKDSKDILEIYQYYVENSIATFAYTCPDLEEYRQWVEQSALQYPFLVLERAGKIIGFAYAHRWREREAFDWAVETSIYLAPDVTGGERGVRLYGTLLALLREQGIYQAYAVLANPNPASETMHQKIGFTQLGSQPCCGWKHGQWQGNTLWGYCLREPNREPAPVMPFCELNQEKLTQLMEHC